MCDLCSRMTRLSCQRDIHAIVSWLEQMNPTQVHVDLNYTAHRQFAKLVRIGSANEAVVHINRQCQIDPITEWLQHVHLRVKGLSGRPQTIAPPVVMTMTGCPA